MKHIKRCFILFIIMASLLIAGSALADDSDISKYIMLVNDREVGVVTSAAKGLAIYDDVIQQLKNNYNDEVSIEGSILFRQADKEDASSTSLADIEKSIEDALNVKSMATAILIDNNRACYVKTKQDAQAVLDQIKKMYMDKLKDDDNSKVEDVSFKEYIVTQEELAPYSQILNSDRAIKVILEGTDNIEEYEIQEGDSLWSIARNNDMHVYEIQEANPNIKDELIKPGQKIRLKAPKSMLTVAAKQKIKIKEDIPYTTELKKDDNMYKGEHKVVTNGEKGEKEIEYIVVTENGEEISREKVDEKVSKSKPAKKAAPKRSNKKPSAAKVKRSNSSSVSRSATPIGRGGVQMTPWSVASGIYTRGSVAKVTDVNTGTTFYVKRRGGTKHADSEPLTRADTNKINSIYSKESSRWNRRAIVVEVNGKKMAASMNGMPHGGSSIGGNGFNGHFCIHFYGSRTHGGNRLDPDHQAAVRRAAGY